MDGARLIARSQAGENWRIERRGRQLRAVRPDGVPTEWQSGAVLVRSVGGDSFLSWNNRRYRGSLALSAGDTSILVVNQLSVEDYLRGVVPGEIGDVAPSEHAAAEAQAVAARSYAYVRLRESSRAPYDIVAGVADQVYAGANAEKMISDLAIASTTGEVLMYGGRAVSAPYHSTCGGSTAAASEVWRQGDEPFLRQVSDRIPGSDRYYCDPSPRFRWTRRVDEQTLQRDVDLYLLRYASAPTGSPGAVRGVRVNGLTQSGRAASVTFDTERGSYSVRGNDVRFVLRSAGGEILNSTYFSVAAQQRQDGRVESLTLTGSGNGHGVGMCQWGAIGRARSGQDYRTILRTYFPGTTLGQAQ